MYSKRTYGLGYVERTDDRPFARCSFGRWRRKERKTTFTYAHDDDHEDDDVVMVVVVTGNHFDPMGDEMNKMIGLFIPDT